MQHQHDTQQKKYLQTQSKKVYQQQLKLLHAAQVQECSVVALKEASSSIHTCITSSVIQTHISNHQNAKNKMYACKIEVDIARLLGDKLEPWQYEDSVDCSFNSGLEAAFTDYVSE